MIPFFRHIREKLFSTLPADKAGNRITRYFFYALGEIFLVVIGILIALQVNNWNEEKKDRAYELKMLREVQEALETDILDSERNIERVRRLDSASSHIIQLAVQKTPFLDTLYLNGISRWYLLRTGINYNRNTGPYEAIKSSGLDKISNDSIRKQLVNYFDFRVVQQIRFIDWINRDYESDVDRLESFLGDPEVEEVDGKFIFVRKFPKDLLLKKDFLLLLENTKTRAEMNLTYLKNYAEEMRRLSAVLSQELKR